LESHGDDTWVAFGDHGSKVSIVRINKVTNARKRRECGFKYIECEIGEVIDSQDMTVSDLETIMVRYCLLLPFVYNKEANFGKEYAIIYDDWEVCNELGGRELPHVCEILFGDDVLSNN
jgi:hypothetical protein